MERTLTPKSIRLRELSQWTAATTLVAAGALGLFSATTIEKLSKNGEVSVDLQAFRKVYSASLALDRIDEQKMLQEEARLLDHAAFAAAEALPVTHTAFTQIRLHPRKTRVFRTIAKAHVLPAMPPHRTEPVLRTLSGSPVVLSEADATEIAQLEHAPDPAAESLALAQVYRNLHFQFIAAVNAPDGEYPAEAVAIAKNTESREYDELPDFDPSDFTLIGTAGTVIAIETAPARAEEIDSRASARAEVATHASTRSDPSREPDQISVSSSSEVAPSMLNALTADVSALQSQKDLPTVSASAHPSAAAATIGSPGLDLVPVATTDLVATHPEPRLDSQNHEVKQATGPPGAGAGPQTPELTAPAPQEQSPMEARALDAASTPEVSPSDIREYSSDVAAVYQSNHADIHEVSSDYSGHTQADAIIDGDFTARPQATQSHTLIHVAPTKPTLLAGRQDVGNGVHRDSKGITIDWSENEAEGGKVAATSLGGKVFVGRPGDHLAGNSPGRETSLGAFSFSAPSENLAHSKSLTLSQSSAKMSAALEPAVDTKKCNSARNGVEAFNAGAEKDVLSICRRELSLEGSREGPQSSWWESYENDAEHWPTLSFAKANDISPDHRIPLLSTASIRILSAISKTNTHTGTGILFGEVAKGLEIQLLGRSDTPIYLDAGMKIRDPSADVTGARQFVFLNVEPGQPLLVVKTREKNISGAIPLVVKSGMATHLSVSEPREADLEFTVFDASSAKESRLANLTAEVIGQPGKIGITDRNGNLKIRKVALFDDFPIYVDVLKNEKSYKNRFRLRPATIARGAFPFFFFDEKRVDDWLAQLSGGLSPYSGLIAGVAPNATVLQSKSDPHFLKIGILEKKGILVPERYLLDQRDRLLSDSALGAGRARYIGVQIPEGPAIPTIVDSHGAVIWSELVFAQPGVINVVNPDL